MKGPISVLMFDHFPLTARGSKILPNYKQPANNLTIALI